ncbi:helicase-related protein [Sorangium sp. So ce185]|uniref:helicase-related protein n=1 Tax=Sorangium sp. So ce185 TaxID=3133287 RepID=UPI003F5EBD9B
MRVLLSTDAGGVGLNLQAASYVVHLDLPWNPARLDQRTARAHRMGQARGVSVTYLCAEEGIERGIEGILAEKRKVLSASLRADAAVEELAAPSFAVVLREMRQVLAAAEGAGASEGSAEVPESAEVPGSAAALPAKGEGDGGEAAPGAVAAWPGGEAAPGAVVAWPGGEAAPGAVVAWPGGEAAPANDAAVMGAGAETAAMEVAVAGDEAGGGQARTPPVRPRPGAETARKAAERLRLARVVLDAGFAADAARAAYEALAGTIAGMLQGPAPESHAALIAGVYRDLVPGGGLPVEAHAALARLHDLGTLARAGVPLDAALARSAVDEAATWIGRLEGEGAARPGGSVAHRAAEGSLLPAER